MFRTWGTHASKYFRGNGDIPFGMRGIQRRCEKLKEIEMLFQLEDDFESTQKECGNLENLKNVADLGKEGELVQLQKEKGNHRRIFKID